jgi:hypothetical protein
MKVVNNTNKIVTLANGKRIPAYGTINISNPTEEVLEQISNLIKSEILKASF